MAWHDHFSDTSSAHKHQHTCQLFLRYRCKIFILAVLGFLKTIISEDSRRSPKSSENVRTPSPSLRTHINTSLLPVLFTSKIRDSEECIVILHFTHGFRSLHGSELTYFWKLCQARRQQLTLFNQAWEIGPQAWAGMRSKFSTCRRETHA